MRRQQVIDHKDKIVRMDLGAGKAVDVKVLTEPDKGGNVHVLRDGREVHTNISKLSKK